MSRCEGSGVRKLVPEVLCCCGQRLTVVDNQIPEHDRSGPIVNAESAPPFDAGGVPPRPSRPPQWPVISEPPTVPELEALRQTLEAWDDWPSPHPVSAGNVIEAARAVLRLYDEQQLKYKSAMEAQLSDDALKRLMSSAGVVTAGHEPHKPDCPKIHVPLTGPCYYCAGR